MNFTSTPSQRAQSTGMPPPLLEVRNLVKHYQAGGSWSRQRPIKAVDGVSFTVRQGETLGLVGESGCGKSTAAKTILRLLDPTSGQILLNGQEIGAMSARAFRQHRSDLQIVFQDPYSSLNPRMSAGEIVAEPLRNFGRSQELRNGKVAMLFEKVGLDAAAMAKYPGEFSGGQRQRLGIARALALDPKLIVCDEPVSALDVSIQAQVINLLADLQRDLGLSYVFVAHDLAVVRHISHRVAVMYLGRIVEIGPVDRLYANPLHPYTEALLSAVPRPGATAKRQKILLKGDIPSPANPPSGCTFRTRCPVARPACSQAAPALTEVEAGHWVACPFQAAERTALRPAATASTPDGQP